LSAFVGAWLEPYVVTEPLTVTVVPSALVS
jgi:hypothetical protein